MTTIHYPLTPADASVVASLRQAMSAQKGKYMGTGARQQFEAQKNGVQPADCQTTPGVVGGVSGWWCHPANPRPDAALIYYHGGWYMLGTAESFRNQASHYAVRTRASTFVPDYRRAPEAPFPAAYDDALAVYRAMSEQGRKIALVGDSVGGALSLLVLAAAAAKPNGLPRPLGAVAMSPVTDLTLSSASMQTRAQADPIFTRDMVVNFVDAYLNRADTKDPRASPLYSPIEGLPPILIDVGEDEILLDGAVRYADRATDQGVEVTLGIWAGMPHTFPGLIGKLAAATVAVEAECDFLNKLIDTAG
jgi:monoterpene epsilon-lactone hydrolase